MRNRDSKTSRRIVGVTLAIFVVLALPVKAAGQTDNTAYGNRGVEPCGKLPLNVAAYWSISSAFGDNALYDTGAWQLHTRRSGANALEHLICPINAELYNTAVGFDAQEYDDVRLQNTATGAGTSTSTTMVPTIPPPLDSTPFSTILGLQHRHWDIDALVKNTSGTKNTATGAEALLSANTTRQSKPATGYGALYSNTADNNTATGTDALIYNTSGTQNTATGGFALDRNSSGSFNTANRIYRFV